MAINRKFVLIKWKVAKEAIIKWIWTVIMWRNPLTKQVLHAELSFFYVRRSTELQNEVPKWGVAKYIMWKAPRNASGFGESRVAFCLWYWEQVLHLKKVSWSLRSQYWTPHTLLREYILMWCDVNSCNNGPIYRVDHKKMPLLLKLLYLENYSGYRNEKAAKLKLIQFSFKWCMISWQSKP